ncbi:glycerol-3-phosphate 1-O-acyltransferase PlsY [Malonomonas rubra]|uniref:glycerol-3-phosphate 1-O-acyltransferase PlsY n=1 Tax=Malonomonas rubra TaxID=57040 RepID=UPI0026F069AD|nr:glycerol-3-phosphate 1-O-acyltransferase PlsY [Malonomonas rubra]
MGFFFLLVLAYLIGAIPTGVILTKLTGEEDIRTIGSGNIGATNVYRTAGRKMGLLTLAGDCLKGILPLLIALIFGFHGTQLAVVGLFALVGHCYPVYLGFKGGKGVATALGVMLIISPGSVLLVLSLFLVVLGKWRYISLASITCAGVIPYLVLALERSMMIFFVTFCIAALVIYRHKENIDRLLAGAENKFSL